MTDEETIALLALAALFDPRMKRVDDEEATDRALAWHLLLADVAASDAATAVRAHYATSRESIMPADILARVGVTEDPHESIRDYTADVIAESKRAQLEAAGLTEEEFEARKHDPAWIAATFPTAAIEAAPSNEEWL